MKIKTVGIIGYGQFGRLMYEYLSEHFDVRVYDKNDSDSDLAHVCTSDIVTFAIPVQSLVESCKEVSQFVSKETIIMDVTSVKVKPLEILKQYFPDNPILGTHPIFGPQSVADNGGIVGLPIVLTNISLSKEQYQCVRGFVEEGLQLAIIEKSAESHDKEMAMVQGLSHFIGRALKHMNIEDYETGTHSYKQLVKLKELLQYDSWELFETIQNNNPYICETRKDFIKELQNLEDKLGNVC